MLRKIWLLLSSILRTVPRPIVEWACILGVVIPSTFAVMPATWPADGNYKDVIDYLGTWWDALSFSLIIYEIIRTTRAERKRRAAEVRP